jgi:hypothetical protein
MFNQAYCKDILIYNDLKIGGVKNLKKIFSQGKWKTEKTTSDLLWKKRKRAYCSTRPET